MSLFCSSKTFAQNYEEQGNTIDTNRPISLIKCTTTLYEGNFQFSNLTCAEKPTSSLDDLDNIDNSIENLIKSVKISRKNPFAISILHKIGQKPELTWKEKQLAEKIAYDILGKSFKEQLSNLESQYESMDWGYEAILTWTKIKFLKTCIWISESQYTQDTFKIKIPYINDFKTSIEEVTMIEPRTDQADIFSADSNLESIINQAKELQLIAFSHSFYYFLSQHLTSKKRELANEAGKSLGKTALSYFFDAFNTAITWIGENFLKVPQSYKEIDPETFSKYNNKIEQKQYFYTYINNIGNFKNNIIFEYTTTSGKNRAKLVLTPKADTVYYLEISTSQESLQNYSDSNEENFVEIDGKRYPTIKIGNQVWMAENLRNDNVTHYSINNDSRNDYKYGYLYTWQNAKKACPSGWRLPTKNEFEQLLTATGADSNSSSLRAASWENGSNSSGFGALPAGYRDDNGLFSYFGSYALFWSATPGGSDRAYYLCVGSGDAYVRSYRVDFAFSVRCIKEDSNSDPCQGITYQGKCDGNTLIWCEKGIINKQYCDQSGKLCTFVDTTTGYLCK